MDPERPRFKRRVITYNPGLTETYCQACNQFLGAGRSEAHLRLLESAPFQMLPVRASRNKEEHQGAKVEK